jgi:cyclopropane-fatty-acyl-phospholipid synthase
MTVSTTMRWPSIARTPRAPLHASVARAIFERAVRMVPVQVSTPDGVLNPETPRPGAPEFRIVRPGAFFARLGRDTKVGFGESYMAGDWRAGEGTDLADLLTPFAARLTTLVPQPLQRLRAVVDKRIPQHHENTLEGSRDNIAAHYDLSNDLYRLFLDETLTYSSAVFATPDQPLADAQRNKYRLIAKGARLAAGDHVLEIGTGWGGFALYAAGEIGCRVTSITISQQQYELARERVRTAGLEGMVDIQLRDYRDITGVYDAIVSIEMLEAVGAEYFATFFETCDRALRPGGRLSVQVITFPDAAYERQLHGANWIQTYIFPGGLCPSLAVLEAATRDTRFLIADVRDIADDYVRTLQAWRTKFMSRLDAVRSLGFDERFIRMWEYYLALSEAGFATGISQDLQIAFEKRRGIG